MMKLLCTTKRIALAKVNQHFLFSKAIEHTFIHASLNKYPPWYVIFIITRYLYHVAINLLQWLIIRACTSFKNKN